MTLFCGMIPVVARAPSYVNPWTYDTEHTADANTILLLHCEDDAANTTITDSSGNSYDWTASANTSLMNNATGKFGDCFDLDDQYEGTINNDTFDNAFSSAAGSTITVELWIKSTAANWSDAGNQQWVNIRKADSNDAILLGYLVSGDQLEFRYKAGGTTNLINVTSAIVDTTTWHHVALTANVAADEMKAFVDGSQFQSTETGLGTWSATILDAMIGEDAGGGENFDGMIDEVAVSNVCRY